MSARDLRSSASALCLSFALLAPGTQASQDAPPPEVEPASGAMGAAPEPGVAGHLATYDPIADGWESEAASELIGARLRELTELWSARGVLGAEDLAPFATADVRARGLAPAELALVIETRAFRVLRPEGEGEPASEGHERLAAALSELATRLGGSGFRASLKVESVEESELGARVRLRCHAVGRTGSRVVEYSDLWACECTLAPDAPPQLASLESLAFELVEGPRTGGTLFTDVTGSVFAGVPAFEAQLLEGLGTWQRRLSASFGLSVLGDQGLALGDVDGDGLEDLYLCEPGGMTNRLLRRRPDGTLEDVSAAAGVDILDLTASALFVDLDGDRDLDLALATAEEVLLLANDGAGHFELRTAQPVATPMSLAAADVDLDSDLDLYVCGYFSPYDDHDAPVLYHDAQNGAPNALLRNEGDFRFEDATAELGLGDGNNRFSFAASFEDYDQDGDQDLYVANDFGRNNLYRNEGGRFADAAAEAGVEDTAAGMGVSWGDFDGDGWVDLYVSNMDSKAGRRIAYQRRFRPGSDAHALDAFRRHSRGNSLFLNHKDGTFVDVSEERRVERGLWAWGSLFLDLDLDGRLDLCVPNGFVTNERYDDL